MAQEYKDNQGNSALYEKDFLGEVELRNKSGESIKISGQFIFELVARHDREALAERLEKLGVPEPLLSERVKLHTGF